MKIKSIFFGLIGWGCMLLLAACEKGDSEKEWGESRVYIPQATLLDGGITTHYPVPFNASANAQNYVLDTVDTHTLNVVLGVYRSGLAKLDGFSVTVSANDAVLQEKLQAVPDAVPIPEGLISFPASVQVPSGEREAIFYLTIDYRRLVEEYGALYGKNLIAVLSIANPTNYTLNEALSTVAIVIDSKAFLPEPELPDLIRGGKFDAGDDAHWHVLAQDQGAATVVPSIALAEQGRFTVSSGAGIFNHAIYQKIGLEAGRKYRFSVQLAASGITNGWLEFYVSPNAPVPDGDYAWGRLFGFDTWAGCLSGNIEGFAEEMACVEGQAFGTGGTFTAEFSGEGYFVVKFGVWDGVMGSLSLDNVRLLELE